MNATPYTKKTDRVLRQVRALLAQNNPHLRQEFADRLAAELDYFCCSLDLSTSEPWHGLGLSAHGGSHGKTRTLT